MTEQTTLTKSPPHLTRKAITLTGLVFIGLKLSHVIAWSWWVVLSPFILGVVVSLLLGVVIGINTSRTRND